MSISFYCFFFLLCLAAVAGGVATGQGECEPTQCGHSGPAIRFPFWLKGHQPERCGFPRPNFQLSCSTSNTTELDIHYPVHIPEFPCSACSASNVQPKNILFPFEMKFQVLKIDYASQRLYVSIAKPVCFPNSLAGAVDLSPASPLMECYWSYFTGLSLFNCTSGDITINGDYSWRLRLISCLSGHGYQVFASKSYSIVWYFNLSSCKKMYDIDVPEDIWYGETSLFHWLEPSCGDCEAQGKYCRLKNNSRAAETECFDIPTQPRNRASKKLVIAVVTGTLLLVLVISIVSYLIITLKKKKEDQIKVEKFLDDYKALRPTRFSYADIKRITDKFKEKLGEGGYGTVYKGNLSHDIPVAVKVLKNFKGNGEEFINEVRTIGTIHHINVVRLVGYCADGYRGALLYEFLPNDSLEKLLSSRKRVNSLGWVKLQQIAIGIAKGLDYLHQGCNQRILHFDIKPQNMLLDQNFNPKVADFGLAKLCSKEQSAVSMTAARGTIGYIAPEVFSRNFGNVSYKSDVYSFGMLLIDMVGGRKSQSGEEDSSQMYFPEWMYRKLDKGEEIEIQIDKEEDSRIFKKLAIVGLWCIQWCPADRPSMKVAIQMLEGENMPTMPPNPFAAAKSTIPNAFTSGSSSPSDSEIRSISETT